MDVTESSADAGDYYNICEDYELLLRTLTNLDGGIENSHRHHHDGDPLKLGGRRLLKSGGGSTESHCPAGHSNNARGGGGGGGGGGCGVATYSRSMDTNAMGTMTLERPVPPPSERPGRKSTIPLSALARRPAPSDDLFDLIRFRNFDGCNDDVHSEGRSGMDADVLVPLRVWMNGVSANVAISPCQTAGRGDDGQRRTLVNKTTVAYGIAALLNKSTSLGCLEESAAVRVDNFVVRTSAVSKVAGGIMSSTSEEIKGVDMLSPRLSVNIIDLYSLFGGDGEQNGLGRYLEAEFPSLPDADGVDAVVDQIDEDGPCHFLGIILHTLFADCHPRGEAMRGNKFHTNGGFSKSAEQNTDNWSKEPSTKKIQLIDPRAREGTGSTSSRIYVDLLERGIPSNLCLMIQNLLECGSDNRSDNAYDSLCVAIKDLHLLLLDPDRFLFDGESKNSDSRSFQLSFREHKLYGREKEASIITDAFCRVSGGKIESCFIGGFSGSGKSRLVNELTAKIDMVGGYVLTRKFDLNERPMLEVVAMFNDLCLLIVEKNSRQDLLVIVKDLVNVFGSDIHVLARLVPNVRALIPNLTPPDEKAGVSHMSVQSICFTIQRFIRVVSSEKYPVIIFLDDLQWCDKSAFTVVESILCDSIGTSCVFFVGTYRSNEVADDHEIFLLAHRLRNFGVPTTMLSLEGLGLNDLNTMISDAMCVFPRISKPLSDIVFEKTEGNPFFVLAFLRSLVDRGLLEYSTEKGMWVWDAHKISYTDVACNVLYLLTSKYSGLPENIQSALKLAACFGVKVKESVIETLGRDPGHPDIRDNLEGAVTEGFMVKVGISEFKFVHDNVREAAYSLIPEQEKNQYHYNLGMSLYLMTKGQDVNDIVFPMVDQIKLGIDYLEDDNPEFRVELAKLNEIAGMKAVVCSDYETARSYFAYAMSLLPNDHWKSHYDITLRCSLGLAKTQYSCGDVDNAQCTLQDVIRQCESFEDTLPACDLLVRFLYCHRKIMDGYILCHQVLTQLGEEIPNSLNPVKKYELIQQTTEMVNSTISDDKDLVEMNELDERLAKTMRFYHLITGVAFLAKKELAPFFACRMVQLTVRSGVCKSSLFGLVQYASVIIDERNDFLHASKIGKAAVSCWRQRYHSECLLPGLCLTYYGRVAHYTEPIQVCADMLRQGFETGMSLGETGVAFLNALQHIQFAFFSGERLPTLLERIDYYFELNAVMHKNEMAELFLPFYREMIATIINNEESTISKRSSNVAPNPYISDIVKNVLLTAASQFPKLAGPFGGGIIVESIHACRGIQSFWADHHKRCRYSFRKFLQIANPKKFIGTIVTFYDGLTTFRMLSEKAKQARSLPENVKGAIKRLEVAASHSSWNFRNKVQLLEAEKCSFLNRHQEAMEFYLAAISSARLSGFIHEQGLACELAGYHCEKIGDLRNSCNFFEQAAWCYTSWGSQLKVKSVNRQLDYVRAAIHGGEEETSGDDSFVGRLSMVVKSYGTIALN